MPSSCWPNSPHTIKGSRKPRRISLDDSRAQAASLGNEALTARALVAHAELDGLVPAGERSNHGPIDRALLAAEVDALDERAVRPQGVRELLLQRPEGGLRIRLGFLRGHLDQESAVAGGSLIAGRSGLRGRD